MIKERKYPLLLDATDHLRWNCEVRRHLYAVVKNMRAVKAYHIESWEQGTGHPTPCA